MDDVNDNNNIMIPRQEGGEDGLPVGDRVGNRRQRKWDIAKVVLRAFCVFLVAVDAAELIALQTSWKTGSYTEGIGYPVLVALALWDLIEFVVIIARRGVSNGIRAEAHVGVELVLWIGTGGTVAGQGTTAIWKEIIWPTVDTWGQVVLTQLGFLTALFVFRFFFFVRACIEVDRKRKDRRRAQELDLALQKQEQGQSPQSLPPETFGAVQSASPRAADVVSDGGARSPQPQPQSQSQSQLSPRPRSAPEERDFAYKYNFPTATVPELLRAGVHPEDARNQKVLAGIIPR